MIVGFLLPVKAGQPRFPFPKNPDQVWQNDLDLNDKINLVTSTSSVAGSFIQNTNVLQTGSTFFVSSGTAVNFNATKGIFQKIGISSDPAHPFVVKTDTGSIIITQDGRVGIGGVPEIFPNFQETLRVERNAPGFGNPSVDSIVINTNGGGNSRMYVQVGNAANNARAFQFSIFGANSPSTWWAGGPAIANSIAIVDDQNASFAAASTATFLIINQTTNSYWKTSTSGQLITFVANTSTMALLNNGLFEANDGSAAGGASFGFWKDVGVAGRGTGIYRPGDNVLGFMSASARQAEIAASSATFFNSLAIGNGTQIQKVIGSTLTVIDFPSTASTCSDVPVTVTGALDNDVCTIGPPIGSVTATAQFSCFVSAADTVTTRVCTTGATENPGSGNYRIMLTRF